MTKILKLFIVVLMAKSLKFEVINYSCNITVSDPNVTEEKNCCKVEETLIIHDKNVTIITSDKDDKIVSFYAENMEIHYFPNGIDKDFPNLQNLVIKNSKLQEITSNDLKVFKYLQYIDLSYNEIEVLGPNLFNTGLTILQIFLHDNKIQFIHSTAFKPKNGLKYLDMRNNLCTSGMANDNSKLNTLLNVIKVSCPFYPVHIKELQAEIQIQKEDLKKFGDKIEKKLNILYIVVGVMSTFCIVIAFTCIKRKLTKKPGKKFTKLKLEMRSPLRFP